jgi:hypothetical protein
LQHYVFAEEKVMARTIKWIAAGSPSAPHRRLAAAALVAAGAALTRLAARLEAAQAASAARTVEFAELRIAGQAGGALYEDGKLFGWLPGVTRL